MLFDGIYSCFRGFDGSVPLTMHAASFVQLLAVLVCFLAYVFLVYLLPCLLNCSFPSVLSCLFVGLFALCCLFAVTAVHNFLRLLLYAC